MSANATGALLASFDGKSRQAEGVASITVTVGDENADVRTVVGQLFDANGAHAQGKRIVEVVVWASAAQAALATTGGSTGLAVASGTILVAAITAKKVFRFLSDSDGKVNLTWTDTATETVAVSMHCDGKNTVTAAFANAA